VVQKEDQVRVSNEESGKCISRSIFSYLPSYARGRGLPMSQSDPLVESFAATTPRDTSGRFLSSIKTTPWEAMKPDSLVIVLPYND